MNPPVTAELLALIRCPITLSDLSVADSGLLLEINQRIEQREAVNRLGQIIDSPIDAGLVNADRSWLLPVRGKIVVLVADQAIPLKST